MKVINESKGYESGKVWIPQWYEKEHLELFIGESITDEKWERFLEWKKDSITDMRYEIVDDYGYFKESL